MNLQIQDKQLFLDQMQVLIEAYYKKGIKDHYIDVAIPEDRIHANFKEVFLQSYKSYTIVRSWLIAFPVGVASVKHSHENELLVCFLQTHKNCGNLVLEYKTIVPVENNLIIVPKGETHKIEENKSDTERISLAIEFKGEKK